MEGRRRRRGVWGWKGAAGVEPKAACDEKTSEVEEQTVLEDFVALEIYLAAESLCFTFNNKMYCYSFWLRTEF